GGTIGRRLGVVRLTRRGFVDRRFGRAGQASSRGGRFATASDLRIEANGHIIVAGRAYTCKIGSCRDASPVVARFTGDGKLDRGFGRRGVWIGLPGAVSALKAVAFGRESIVAGGSTGRPEKDRDLLLLRLHR